MSFKFENPEYIPKEKLDELSEEEKKKAIAKNAVEGSRGILNLGLADTMIPSRKQPQGLGKTVDESLLAASQAETNAFKGSEDKTAVDKSLTSKFIDKKTPTETDPEDPFIKGKFLADKKTKTQIINEEQILTETDPWRKSSEEKTEDAQNRKDLDKPYV